MSDAMTIRMMGWEDGDVLDHVSPDVFDGDIDPRCFAEFLTDSRHHMALALVGDLVVGFASAVHYVHPDKPSEMWINEIVVSDSQRRRGIGKQLLEKLFEHARELGCKEAWVLTDEDNAGARGLYAAAGGKEKPSVIVSFNLGSGRPERLSDPA